jgi:predicted ester cyclase
MDIASRFAKLALSRRACNGMASYKCGRDTLDFESHRARRSTNVHGESLWPEDLSSLNRRNVMATMPYSVVTLAVIKLKSIIPIMTTDVSTNVARREYLRRRLVSAVDTFNAHDVDKLGDLFNDNVILFRSGSDPIHGKAAYLDSDRRFLEAFPDARIELRNVLVDEEVGVLEFVMRGHHASTFRGIAPTGRDIAIQVVEVLSFAGDHVFEVRRYLDNSEYERQLVRSTQKA